MHHSYLFGLVFSSLIASSLRDPGEGFCVLDSKAVTHTLIGIIPRNLDPDPPLSQVDSWDEPDNREMTIKSGK